MVQIRAFKVLKSSSISCILNVFLEELQIYPSYFELQFYNFNGILEASMVFATTGISVITNACYILSPKICETFKSVPDIKG